MYKTVLFQVFLSNTNNVYTIIWFQVTNNNLLETNIASSNYS